MIDERSGEKTTVECLFVKVINHALQFIQFISLVLHSSYSTYFTICFSTHEIRVSLILKKTFSKVNASHTKANDDTTALSRDSHSPHHRCSALSRHSLVTSLVSPLHHRVLDCHSIVLSSSHCVCTLHFISRK